MLTIFTVLCIFFTCPEGVGLEVSFPSVCGKKFVALYLLSLFIIIIIFPISLGLDVPKVGSLKFIRLLCLKVLIFMLHSEKLMKNLGM